MVDSRTATFCGTLEYMAPEMMANNDYGFSADWFSFGILLFEMLSCKNPFKNDNQEPASREEVPMKMQEILNRNSEEFFEGCEFTPESQDLLEKLLRYDPEMRIGCRENLGVNEIK